VRRWFTEASVAAEIREVMDIDEVSEYLGVSRAGLYKYIHEGRIRAFKLGNRWKFKRSVLDQWMEKQSTHRQERG
jgi:excisionase family DNA binding protein